MARGFVAEIRHQRQRAWMPLQATPIPARGRRHAGPCRWRITTPMPAARSTCSTRQAGSRPMAISGRGNAAAHHRPRSPVLVAPDRRTRGRRQAEIDRGRNLLRPSVMKPDVTCRITERYSRPCHRPSRLEDCDDPNPQCSLTPEGMPMRRDPAQRELSKPPPICHPKYGS